MVAEMRLFPNGKHDDQIDALSRTGTHGEREGRTGGFSPVIRAGAILRGLCGNKKRQTGISSRPFWTAMPHNGARNALTARLTLYTLP